VRTWQYMSGWLWCGRQLVETIWQQNRKYLYLWNSRNLTVNLGFLTTASRIKVCIYSCFGANCRLSLIVAITCLHFYRVSRSRKCRICRCNFDAICDSSGDISISGFGGHIAISRFQSLSQPLSDTFFERSMIVNPRFAVGISVLSVTVSAI